MVLPLFVVALFYAWRSAGIAIENVNPVPVLGVLAVVPLTVLTSMWQLRAIGSTSGTSIPWWSAFRVVTLGTLSGLLPISSGTMVRAGAVVYWGGSARLTGHALVLDAVLWLLVSLLYSGGAAGLEGATVLSAAMTTAGIVLVPIAIIVGKRFARARSVELTGARAVGMFAEVLRLQLCFIALGYAVTFVEVSTLAAASPLSALLFFLPSGLGVREGFTSAVAAAVGLSAAGAFLAAALNRLLGLSLLLIWEAMFFVGKRLPLGGRQCS